MSFTGEDSRETRLLGGLRIFSGSFCDAFSFLFENMCLVASQTVLLLIGILRELLEQGRALEALTAAAYQRSVYSRGVPQTVLDLRTLVKC